MSSQNHFHSSMNYAASSSMKRQPSNGNTRQEQSVERLKSCIADLKKLASNKVVNSKKSNNNQQYLEQQSSFGEYDSRREKQGGKGSECGGG